MFRKLCNLNIGTKRWLLSLATGPGVFLLAAEFRLSERQRITNERNGALHNAVEFADGSVQHFHAQAASGATARVHALPRARGARRCSRTCQPGPAPEAR